jgi:hypothetical protein
VWLYTARLREHANRLLAGVGIIEKLRHFISNLALRIAANERMMLTNNFVRNDTLVTSVAGKPIITAATVVYTALKCVRKLMLTQYDVSETHGDEIANV